MKAAIAIAVIIVALAFAILVGYLVLTLIEARRILGNVADTLDGIETQMEGITSETTLLIQKTNDLAEDVNFKVNKLNSLFEGVEDIGDSFNVLTGAVKNLTYDISNKNRVINSHEESSKSKEVLKWGSAILNLISNR